MIRIIIKLILSVFFLFQAIVEIKKAKFGSDVVINLVTFLCILAIIWYL